MPQSADAGRADNELIALCDGEGCIRFVSRSFAEFFGASASNWFGRSFAPGGAATGASSRRYKTSAKAAAGECTIEWEETQLASGERLYVGSPLASQSARRAEQPRQDSDKMRFLATMSHEMRTPLNGILGMTGLLLDTDLSANQRAYAEAVRESGAALLALINDILDYSKLEAGRLDLEQSLFDPYALVQNVTELLSPRAADKGIEIASFVDPATPRRLVGDEARLRQVLINLAGNGVKFTDRGGVAIEASIVDAGGGEFDFAVSVRDTGVGIPGDAQQRIFEEFAQADDVASRRSQGTGLGLAISKKLVRAMGGDITLESEPGNGSVFAFRVRVKSGADATPFSAVDAGPIIVATKSATLERILSQQIKSFSSNVFRVERDASGVSAALAASPDATLLCDLAIIDAGGAGLASIARRSIALVAANERGAIERLRSAGFDGYLVKPIRQTTLMRELSRGGMPAAAKAAPEPVGDRRNKPRAAGRRLRILLAEDNQINAVLATALIRRAGHHVDVAVNGFEAIDAVSRGDYDLVFMDMHMPEMDGLEAARRIRGLKTVKAKTPIVALTANAMASDRQKCVAAGMDDFLSKPFDPADFHAMLDKWRPAEEAIEAAS